MKTLLCRLSDYSNPNYPHRLKSIYTQLDRLAASGSTWIEPTSSAVFLAEGDARHIHDQVRVFAHLLDTDLLFVADHATKTYCVSGAQDGLGLSIVTLLSGYSSLESQAALLRAFVR